jgi:hypothetical protein
MNRVVGVCERCGNPVREGNAAYPITGWEVLRQQGGANAIRERERVPNRVRHESCLPSKVALAAQGSLL